MGSAGERHFSHQERMVFGTKQPGLLKSPEFPPRREDLFFLSQPPGGEIDVPGGGGVICFLARYPGGKFFSGGGCAIFGGGFRGFRGCDAQKFVCRTRQAWRGYGSGMGCLHWVTGGTVLLMQKESMPLLVVWTIERIERLAVKRFVKGFSGSVPPRLSVAFKSSCSTLCWYFTVVSRSGEINTITYDNRLPLHTEHNIRSNCRFTDGPSAPTVLLCSAMPTNSTQNNGKMHPPVGNT